MASETLSNGRRRRRLMSAEGGMTNGRKQQQAAVPPSTSISIPVYEVRALIEPVATSAGGDGSGGDTAGTGDSASKGALPGNSTVHNAVRTTIHVQLRTASVAPDSAAGLGKLEGNKDSAVSDSDDDVSLAGPMMTTFSASFSILCRYQGLSGSEVTSYCNSDSEAAYSLSGAGASAVSNKTAGVGTVSRGTAAGGMPLAAVNPGWPIPVPRLAAGIARAFHSLDLRHHSAERNERH